MIDEVNGFYFLVNVLNFIDDVKEICYLANIRSDEMAEEIEVSKPEYHYQSAQRAFVKKNNILAPHNISLYRRI